jgi:hypothetical protein
MSATTSLAQWLPKRERRSAGAADAWRRAVNGASSRFFSDPKTQLWRPVPGFILATSHQVALRSALNDHY